MSSEAESNNFDMQKFSFSAENILRDDFRDYFLRKRFNFIAGINNYADLTDLYLYLDQDWLNVITALANIQNVNWLVALPLTIFCFREVRLSAELLFSGCTTPGFSHLRSALEAFAQAQKILREPSLDLVWLNREDDRQEYTKHFEKKRKENMFPEKCGFEHLHELWKMLCEAGPHPNVVSLGVSSSVSETEEHVEWSLNFFEVRPQELANNLLLMIQCSLEMYKSTYNAFYERLSLEPDLLPRLHSHLSRYAELKKKYV